MCSMRAQGAPEQAGEVAAQVSQAGWHGGRCPAGRLCRRDRPPCPGMTMRACTASCCLPSVSGSHGHVQLALPLRLWSLRHHHQSESVSLALTAHELSRMFLCIACSAKPFVYCRAAGCLPLCPSALASTPRGLAHERLCSQEMQTCRSARPCTSGAPSLTR